MLLKPAEIYIFSMINCLSEVSQCSKYLFLLKKEHFSILIKIPMNDAYCTHVAYPKPRYNT